MLGYLHEQCSANQTQNSHLKQYIAWGYGTDNLSYVVYDYNISGHIGL